MSAYLICLAKYILARRISPCAQRLVIIRSFEIGFGWMYFSLMSPTKESLASERGDRQMKDTEGDIPDPCIARATDLEGVEASG
jgi:hypothetical protein